jgi:hypothetical protein
MPVVAEWGYKAPNGELLGEDQPYRSDTNSLWMSQADIREFIAKI